MESVISARGLTKNYGAFTAVAGIDFEIFRGECFGFLGPNGAGKSSTMRMLYRTAKVSSGSLNILGMDGASGKMDRAIKRRVGVIPQEDNLDEELSVQENLMVFARFHHLSGNAAKKRVNELLEFVNLTEKATGSARVLSGGQKRRALIARGLISDPEIVILDEPTTGLDPQARHNLWAQLRNLKARKKTLILTTHYMDEAEQLCDRLVIMDNGKIVESGRPRELIKKHVGSHVVEIGFEGTTTDVPKSADPSLLPFTRHVEVFANRLLLHTDSGENLLPLVAKAYPDKETLLRRGSLEDVFLRITGRRLTD